jgi:leucyl-tRNA synthetase
MIKNIQRGYKQDTIRENYRKILTTIMPVIPHFSSECLKIVGQEKHAWPDYDQKIIKEDKINFVIQINGKKRGLIYLENNKSKEEIIEIVKKEESLNKYLKDSKIVKIIFVPKKLINIII